MSSFHKKLFIWLACIFIALNLLVIGQLNGSYTVLVGGDVEEYKLVKQNFEELQNELKSKNRQLTSTKLAANAVKVECDQLQTNYESCTSTKNYFSDEYFSTLDEYDGLVVKYNELLNSCKSQYDSVVNQANTYAQNLQVQCAQGIQGVSDQHNSRYNQLYQQCYNLAQQCQVTAQNYRSCQQQFGQVANIQNVVNTASEVVSLLSVFGLI